MNGKEDIADDFKSPSRWPVVIILLIIACILGYRWHMKKHKMLESQAEVAAVGTLKTNTITVKSPSRTSERQPAALPHAAVTNKLSKMPAQTVTTKPVIVSPADTNSVQVVQHAKELEGKLALVEARAKYLSILQSTEDQALRLDLEQRLSRINCVLVMTPASMPGKQQYVVKSGDSLEKVAKKFGTTVELIRKSNLLNSDIIKAGDRLMVLVGTFAIKIRKVQNDMVVTLNNEFFAKYSVGTGKFGKTPVGTFVINDKIREPVWWRPEGKEIPFGDPENILGTRWMSIKASGVDTPDVKGYGIHGTWDDSSIGKSESAGCIRMKNSEVEQLFMMVPLGTVVTITEQ